MRSPATSDQRPAPIRAPMPQSWIAASTPAALPGLSPRRSCRKSTAKPTTHICGATTSALPAASDQTRASRSGTGPCVLRLVVGRSFPQDDPADDGRGEAAQRRGAANAHGIPQACSIGGMKIETREAADRDRGLADAEREPPLRGGEPGHDGAPARRMDARACEPRREEAREERPEALRPRREQERAAAQADADDQHRALAEAVRRHPPRYEREDRAEQRGGDEDAGLTEREVVLVAQRGSEHRDAEPDRRIGRLREGPGGEDRPAIARWFYSPNGFVGRVPV